MAFMTANTVIGPAWVGATVANLRAKGPPYYAAGYDGAGGYSAQLRGQNFKHTAPSANWLPSTIAVEIWGQGLCAIEAERVIRLQLMVGGIYGLHTPIEVTLPHDTFGQVLYDPGDIWGLATLTKTDVEAADFGVIITRKSQTPDRWVWIDYLACEIGWVEGGSG